MQQIVTINKAAQLGPLNTHALRTMLKAGQLPGFYIGSRYMVNYDLLIEKIMTLSRKEFENK